MRSLRSICMVALLAGATPVAGQASSSSAAATAPAQPATPCADLADARRFDFWVGEWEVRTADGRPVGRSSVRRVAGGCGLQEWWTAQNGSTGTSLNAYNPVEGQWQQFWVGQFGTITEYRRSEWQPDGTLTLLGAGRDRSGRALTLRMSFSPLDDGRVRQLMEQSADEGQTWTVNGDFYYSRATP